MADITLLRNKEGQDDSRCSKDIFVNLAQG